MAKQTYNDSMAQSHSMEHEKGESENYEHNKKVMRGHAPDSRFDEGSTDHTPKIVRPPTSVKPKKAAENQKQGREASLSYGKATSARSSYSPSKLSHTK